MGGTKSWEDNNKLRIDGKGDTATKVFDFGKEYAGETVTITFDFEAIGAKNDNWDSSSDIFRFKLDLQKG